MLPIFYIKWIFKEQFVFWNIKENPLSTLWLAKKTKYIFLYYYRYFPESETLQNRVYNAKHLLFLQFPLLLLPLLLWHVPLFGGGGLGALMQEEVVGKPHSMGLKRKASTQGSGWNLKIFILKFPEDDLKACYAVIMLKLRRSGSGPRRHFESLLCTASSSRKEAIQDKNGKPESTGLMAMAKL